MAVLQFLLAAVAVWVITGTVLNFSKHPHWYVRIWDFPRVFTMLVAGALLLAFAILFHAAWWHWALIVGLALVIVRQVYLIYPYTQLAHKEVKRSDKPWGDDCLRLVISNVLMENTEHALWLEVIRAADPDVLVAVEIDDKWDAALASLVADYPHCVRHPQNNYYGINVYSRLAFDAEPEVRFMVQDDIPSVHLTLRLRDGQRVRLHAMHPRPPEPIRDQDSAARDAELITLAKEIDAGERSMPSIVCGDLNDVAWSFTTQLFLRISGLLDPRKGRGQYNSFNAQSRFMRFPLDHVFHSNEFRLIDLQVLPYAGSDHFPMMIELRCEPSAADHDQPDARPTSSDRKDAEEIIEEQAQRQPDQGEA
ncbi:MAG TPA: endonuclease/exonuclease/phosphatase family protein [Tepidisphaeraceae bacterium]|jgi:endonuclease/exonuclease/phosphatase (EEP) superfamily protein YafD